jgi:hypothetical protein
MPNRKSEIIAFKVVNLKFIYSYIGRSNDVLISLSNA